MAILAGGRLGPYKTLSANGAGGMGEVHCGRDSKPRRDAAIKALPEQFRNTQARTEPSTVDGGAVMLLWVEKPTPLGGGEVTPIEGASRLLYRVCSKFVWE